MEALIPFIAILLVGLFIGGIILWSRHLAKKRREAMAETADSLGLEYLADAPDSMQQRLMQFKLFQRGRNGKISNVIRGDSGEVALAIFDYRFTTGAGKNKQTHNQSVIMLHSPNVACPDFSLRPQNVFDWFGGLVGMQDIDFDSHPEFSKMFVLKGSNEEAIRQFMTPQFLEHLETKPGYTLEAEGNTLFFYRLRRQLKPDQIKDGLSEAYEVYDLVVQQG